MSVHPDSDNICQPDQTPSHTAIFATTGSGKSVLVAQALFDELSKNTQQPKN